MSEDVKKAVSAAEPVSSRNDEAGYVEFLNEDVPYIVRDIQGAVAILMDLETRNVIGYRVYDPDSVFAPPAPSVAVKALEWADKLKRGDREGFVCSSSGVLSYSIMLSRFRVYGIPGEHDGAAEFTSLAEAKAAAQADYEARIRSALSAQVQDVAGWHDISTAPKDGTTFIAVMAEAYSPRATLCKFEDGKFLSPSQGEKFVLPGWNQWWPTHWMPLPGAPAKQEG